MRLKALVEVEGEIVTELFYKSIKYKNSTKNYRFKWLYSFENELNRNKLTILYCSSND